MDVHDHFSMSVITEMRREIQKAAGNEVFFCGTINERGVVVSVAVGSRGNSSSVAINFDKKRNGSVLIHNHPSGNLYPSDADLTVASDASQNAQGFYIVNNNVSDVYVVMEPVVPKTITLLNPLLVSNYLSKNGPFARVSSFYEERKSQIELTKNIAETFNKNAVGVFEAGTGVGKSYAYLIPSMLWAIENKDRIVISTGTINLQQQLIEKDIPASEKIIGKKIKAILVKGRQNYICLRRLEEASRDRDLFSDETEQFDMIVKWAKETKSGSRSDLTFVPAESVWSRVNSESDACMGMRCPFRDQCFVMQVRKNASDANLIIVNHHLLFADIESRMNGVGYDDTAVLPAYRRIVFDEAHGIENAATSFFSESLTRFKLFKQLNLLYRQRRNSIMGYLYSLSALVVQDDGDLTTKAAEEVLQTRLAMQNLENVTLSLLGSNYSQRLFTDTFVEFADILSSLTILRDHTAKLAGVVRSLIDLIPEENKDSAVVWEIKVILRHLDDICLLCKNFCEWEEHPDSVFWIQKLRFSGGTVNGSSNNDYPQFIQTPLDIAPLMNSGVFEPMQSIICTSATLEINGTFNFWERRTGVSFVDSSRVITGEFISPFLYKKNLLFVVPNDAPFPDRPEFQSFVEDAVVRLIEAAKGRTLVLFTAYDSLRHSCDTARFRLRQTGITILKQGDDDRFRLLKTFREDTSSVLFATDSFWEGVDVPGTSLSQVIIVKLPFGVPNDPVFAARAESVLKKGGNPFLELSVPEAVIKFRQGVGRLIRRQDDRGDVVVLDRRIMEKPYGRLFLNSIPDSERRYESFSLLLKRVCDYLN